MNKYFPQEICCRNGKEKDLKISFYCIFLLSFTYVIVEKLFCGQIFKMEITMVLHAMRSLESENHILSVWFVCMGVCVSVITVT